MFFTGDIIDSHYLVNGVCSDSGGMGVILFVEDTKEKLSNIVLKYCRDNNEEQVKRFRREVRLLATFKGNSKVVQIVDYNLDHDPPFFVMKYYPEGDLLSKCEAIKEKYDEQERIILQMIDCIQELHSKNELHRDLKPQNFLIDGDLIVMSDFGLSTELGSDTAFTRSSMYWGTHGYIPPEFLDGGFKHADASGDIFMLGKTIYVLLTQRDPMYPVGDGIPSPLFHVIERCCSIPKSHRYQSLSDLKQSIVAAFDVILGRAGGIGKAKQLLSSINDRLEQENTYYTEEVSDFIEQLALLEENDQIRICFELPRQFFSVIRQGLVVEHLNHFLSIYEKLVEGRSYSWSYAETIANSMKTIFTGDDVPAAEKARALDLAIRAAYYMNRFAAMDTCKSMVCSVQDEELGLEIADVILRHEDTFIADLEVSECESDSIRNALRNIQEQ
jgi:serine/threonine protein kinase